MPKRTSFFLSVTFAIIFFRFYLLSAEEPFRTMRYSSRPEKDAIAWQKELRTRLFHLLKLDDLVSRKTPIPCAPQILLSEQREKYLFQEIEINSTPGRRLKVIMTSPKNYTSLPPAVVCIHGHGGDRHSVYDTTSIYRGFAAVLAEQGYVTIATDVGQHIVYEENRTLMGERLWDLIRCVDFLESLADVDRLRIGCAGLSLGGEMALWLGAMDERIAATVSSGFLTVMDQMEQNHCLCWKFDGLRELVDFADIYSLIAPRPLLCQNGLKEPPTQFYVPIAQRAMAEIKIIYGDFNCGDRVMLQVHAEGHVIDLAGLLEFFGKYFPVRY